MRPAVRPGAARLTLGEALAPLELGRTAALFLLSLHAAGGACIVWAGASLSGLLLLAIGLAGAAALGLLAAPGFDRIERRERERGGLLGALLYALVAGLALGLCVVSPQVPLLRRVALAAAATQAVLLLLAGLDRRGLLAIANALLLVVVTALRGGDPAAWAVTGIGLLLPYVLAYDHAAARLLAHPARVAPLDKGAFRGATAFALPSAALLVVATLAFPAAPYAVEEMPLDRLQAMRTEIEAAYRRLLVLAVFGAAGTLGLARLLRRGEPAHEPVFEGLESAVAEDEALPEATIDADARLDGTRGRIVRAYARLLAAFQAHGHRRQPAETASELGPRLGSARAAVARLTRLFEAARYGPVEPGTEDARTAERDAVEARAGLRPAPGRRRPTL